MRVFTSYFRSGEGISSAHPRESHTGWGGGGGGRFLMLLSPIHLHLLLEEGFLWLTREKFTCLPFPLSSSPSSPPLIPLLSFHISWLPPRRDIPFAFGPTRSAPKASTAHFHWYLHVLVFFFFFSFFFSFLFKLYIIVLVLPNIKMNPPEVYMCSTSWTLLPPPSPYHPSGSSQCTSPKHPVSCIEPGLATRCIHDILHVSMPFSQIFPSSPTALLRLSVPQRPHCIKY